MEIADQRHVDAQLRKPLADMRHGRGGLGGIDRDAHQLGAGAGQLPRPGGPWPRCRRCRCWSSTAPRSELLSRLLANDVARLQVPGGALYSCMLNQQGGVIDDLIVYYLARDQFRLVVNAGTRDKDLAWIGEQAAPLQVRQLVRRDLAMLAVQGPLARQRTATLLSSQAASAAMALQPFHGAQIGEWFIARTGYTGEDGFEIMLPAGEAAALWHA
jgi:aminomethyltransferase